jgi:concanavalin A-like lectin/glucanase superfamily protein
VRYPALLVLAACRFHSPFVGDQPGTGDAPAVAHDAAPDGGTLAQQLCASDSHLPLCFSFDQSPLPATLANEGYATVSATLTNVQRIASNSGGAALLDTTSSITLPFTAQVGGIYALEVWFRVDTDVANGARAGIADSNVIPPNISMFWSRTDPTHQLTCGLGNQSSPFVVTIPIGTWTYVACTCDEGTVTIYVDGQFVASANGDCSTGGAFVADGFTIGANNNGAGNAVNDWLVGAIDGIRLWTQPLSAEDICKTAGRPGC